MKTALFCLIVLSGCIQYKAATMVVKPQAPVVTGSAAVQIAPTVTPDAGSVCEDQAAQSISIGNDLTLSKEFDVEADASDTIAPKTDLASPIQ